jgi:hypothetical protein
MKRILNTVALAIAALFFSDLAASDVAARDFRMQVVQAESDINLTGDFELQAGVFVPFSPQELTPGTADGNAAFPSHRTTFQGWIKVNVDDINNPTTIEIFNSAVAADTSGDWYPKVQPEGQFPSTGPGGDPFPPAMPADFAIELRHPTFGVDVAYAVLRDLVYNITMPQENVGGGGTFISTSQNLELGTPTPRADDGGAIIPEDSGGYFDYWAQPPLNIRGRSDNTGGDDDNESAALSSYVVTMLGPNQRERKLTIPVHISVPRDDDGLRFQYDGQIVARLIVPEPSTFALSGLAMAFASAWAARRRK